MMWVVAASESEKMGLELDARPDGLNADGMIK